VNLPAAIERMAQEMSTTPEEARLLIVSWSAFPGRDGTVSIGSRRLEEVAIKSPNWVLSIYRRGQKAYAAWKKLNVSSLPLFDEAEKPNREMPKCDGYDNYEGLPF
jgi:hypothetical protein